MMTFTGKTPLMLLLTAAMMAGCSTGLNYGTSDEVQTTEGMATSGLIPAATQTDPSGGFVTPVYSAQSYQATRLQQRALQQAHQQVPAQNVNHYVQGMTHDLIANMDLSRQQSVIGVTSFVFLDSPLDRTDLLGNQLAESFMHEVHLFGLPVVDFKTTDYIRVTPQGDFTYSRDFLELQQEQPIEYVLGGTMVQHQGGVLVNARLVSVGSKKVIATAQSFIPAAVRDALQHSESPQRLLLKAGG
ncbi:FlgO family outer membrane protein [Rheinheimera sp.]|uniref:FlgO family outer membrane protein n=1 Tax=Rheinheimera sp. TaxID=1869214 RepID=UPI00307DD801